MDITHLHLHVHDRVRSETFYWRWFGFGTKSSDDEITFMTGDRGFLLALTGEAEPAPMPPWFHFGIRVESAQRVRDTLSAMQGAAVPIVKPLYDDPTFAAFRCADPDAYAIEVYWEAA